MKPTRGQKNVKKIFKAAGLLYPLLNFLSPKNVSTLENVGIAMIHAVEYGYKKHILENLDIAQLARSGLNNMSI